MTSLPLVTQCVAIGLPAPELELRFAPPRRWRFDFAWVGYKLALEVDGGGWINGRHSRGSGIEKDAEKFAEAAILGWTVIRVTPRMVNDGTALDYIKRLLERERYGLGG